MKISPRFTVDDWNNAFLDEPDWDKTIDIVKDRIEGRFVRWIDPLLLRRIRNHCARLLASGPELILAEADSADQDGDPEREISRSFQS